MVRRKAFQFLSIVLSLALLAMPMELAFARMPCAHAMVHDAMAEHTPVSYTMHHPAMAAHHTDSTAPATGHASHGGSCQSGCAACAFCAPAIAAFGIFHIDVSSIVPVSPAARLHGIDGAVEIRPPRYLQS